jgi:hypothetical protein
MSSISHCCQYCGDEPFIAPTKQLLLRHIKVVHSQEPGFTITCEICHRKFRNFRTYQNHLLSHKRDVSVLNEEENSIEPEMMVTSNMDDGNDITDQAEDQAVIPSFTNYCAQWILKISETRKLTRVATVGIVEDVSSLIKEVSSCLHHQVKDFLQKNQIVVQNESDLSAIFSDGATVCPFSNLMTFHQQVAYYKAHFNFIVSINLSILLLAVF